MSESVTIIQKYTDAKVLAQVAAQRFVELAKAAITTQGRFSVALSGGSTPAAMYKLLASEPYANQLDWGKIDVFWGDERCVPPDDSESNYRMAHETLLSHVPLPPANIHRIRGELAPQVGAQEYEATLREYFRAAPGAGRFDLVLLGMGNDGHTLSLFPGSEAARQEMILLSQPAQTQQRWVVANYVEKFSTWRITLTTQPVNAAANILFLVAGADKADALQQVLAEPPQPPLLPAQLIKPINGQLIWMVDEAAAALLDKSPKRT
ncbi:MAG: 6-phosphogluconolactonase [Chloroflexi bacterium]|nr:6-phosphogluconolactonase [Chloroflexota bacterium]